MATHVLVDGATMRPRSDAELVSAARKGDGDAFSELVIRHQDRIYNLVMKFVRNATLAEDVVQRVFINAYQRVGDFKGDAAFTTWIYRIAFNESVSTMRYEGRRRGPSIYGDGGGLIVEPEDAHDPSEGIEREDQRALLMKAMQLIEEEDRKLLLLRELEELPYDEIASILDIPVGTVRSRLHRARESLRAALGTRGAAGRLSMEGQTP